MSSHSERVIHIVLSILLCCMMAGCAAKPREPLTGLVPGREMETLQSSVSLSVRTADRSIGFQGFLIFKRPDRFHMAVLSPFGLTLADIYNEGELLTCVIPSRQTAYAGRIADLPDRNGLRAWALMHWVVERTPVSGPALSRENLNGAGVREKLFFDSQGLLARKETEEGDRVEYRDYRSVNGIAMPETIELGNSRGDRVRISFDEPEVNQPVEESALRPHLEGLTVLPFSEFKGF